MSKINSTAYNLHDERDPRDNIAILTISTDAVPDLMTIKNTPYDWSPSKRIIQGPIPLNTPQAYFYFLAKANKMIPQDVSLKQFVGNYRPDKN